MRCFSFFSCEARPRRGVGGLRLNLYAAPVSSALSASFGAISVYRRYQRFTYRRYRCISALSAAISVIGG
ncbi:MAG: hypothetical protein ACUVTG_09635, partial [Candidatus Oleimicrobiaceae bacterium]